MTSKWHSTTWIIVFSTSSKSHFGLVHRSKISWECHARPWTSFFRPHPSRIYGWSRRWKWVQIDMRALEASLSRPQPSRILGWPRIWKWVQNAMRSLETSHFGLVSRKKMSSQLLATTRNIDFLISPKSNFGLVNRQKMSFKCHSTTWIIALSNWKK